MEQAVAWRKYKYNLRTEMQMTINWKGRTRNKGEESDKNDSQSKSDKATNWWIYGGKCRLILIRHITSRSP